MSLLEVLELSRLDELINVLILYYLFRIGNIAVIFVGNLGEALMKIFRGFTEEV